jgi:hypothetical protein
MMQLSHRIRWSTAAVVAVAVLGAGGTALAVSSPSGHVVPATAYPQCTASGLVNWLDTTGNGAAGSVYYHLKFTNLSGHICTMIGYPGVSAVNLSGGQLGSAASRSTTSHHSVTLAKDATVSALLRIVQVGNFQSSTCSPTTAAGLRVYAPNQTLSKIVPFPFSACAKSGNIYLSVGPITKP